MLAINLADNYSLQQADKNDQQISQQPCSFVFSQKRQSIIDRGKSWVS